MALTSEPSSKLPSYVGLVGRWRAGECVGEYRCGGWCARVRVPDGAGGAELGRRRCGARFGGRCACIASIISFAMTC